MQRKDKKTEAGAETALTAPAAPSPELSDRPQRRTFTARTKLRVLAEVDSATGAGGIGAILRREFCFGHLTQARVADPMHFHAYALADTDKGRQIKLAERVSTDTAGIAQCLGLQTEANVEMIMIVAALEAKLSDRTVFTF